MLFDLNDDRTFRDDRRVRVDIRAIFLDPIARDFHALVGACFVLANSHGHTTIATAPQRVAHETGYFPEGSFDIGLALFRQVEELLCRESGR